MCYAIIRRGESRSFPPGDPFLAGATTPNEAEVVIHIGTPAGAPTRGAPTTASTVGATLVVAPDFADPSKTAVLIELGCECLGVHTGEAQGEEGSNVLGFARYRNGRDAPSPLVELVRQPRTLDTAVAAARAVFERAGLTVVVCSDQPGRIIDRLVRPKYNAALRFLDEGLASARDMDLTCRLGLGYPDGPIERVERGGLVYHYDVAKALFDAYGTAAYAPARRAVVAAARERK